METEMETEHYVLTADSRWFAVYGALITGVAFLSGEFAFNDTSRLDNHNRQRYSFWGQVTWPRLINFGGVTA